MCRIQQVVTQLYLFSFYYYYSHLYFKYLDLWNQPDFISLNLIDNDGNKQSMLNTAKLNNKKADKVHTNTPKKIIIYKVILLLCFWVFISVVSLILKRKNTLVESSSINQKYFLM